MISDKPKYCKNCGQTVLFWKDPYDPKRYPQPRPCDINRYHKHPNDEKEWWHDCKDYLDKEKPNPPNEDYKTKPLLHPCINPPCEFELIYNPQLGFHCEGSMQGPYHWCLHMPKNYEFDPDNPGQKRLKPELTEKAMEYNKRLAFFRQEKKKQQQQQQTKLPTTIDSKVKEVIMTGQAPQQQQGRDMTAVLHTDLREISTILQGIAFQLNKIADNQEVANRYIRTSSIVLTEWKEELSDEIQLQQQKRVKFENGVMPPPDDDDNLGLQEEEEDIYDEISDKDDVTKDTPY